MPSAINKRSIVGLLLTALGDGGRAVDGYSVINNDRNVNTVSLSCLMTDSLILSKDFLILTNTALLTWANKISLTIK